MLKYCIMYLNEISVFLKYLYRKLPTSLLQKKIDHIQLKHLKWPTHLLGMVRSHIYIYLYLFLNSYKNRKRLRSSHRSEATIKTISGKGSYSAPNVLVLYFLQLYLDVNKVQISISTY